jgi:NADPH-dependent 2,4-dienoyl-CoA reductase/sulfur reductase-like enzyme
LEWLRQLRRDVRVIKNLRDFKAGGDGKLEYIEWTSGGKSLRENADILLVHEGVVPRIHETLALGCEHEWHEAQKYFRPKLDRWGETTRKGLFVAGDAGGIGGWGAAAVSGEIAALGIARSLGSPEDMDALRSNGKLDDRRNRALALRPFLDATYPPPRERIADDVIVCRCEEITAGTIRKVTRGGVADPNAVKAATRCGMGPCQGRQCGYSVQAILAEAHGVPIGDVSFFNIRPPLKPVTLGEIASLEEDA